VLATRSLREADVRGRRVLVRVDFNVPMVAGRIVDDTRIRAALPTIEHLVDHGARVILVSHLGRPKGYVADDLRLAPIAAQLAHLLGRVVQQASDVVGPRAHAAAGALRNGDVLLLENVRFEPGEEQNDPELSRRLADLADCYVNDAFGAAHRAHSSTVGVAELLPAYPGFLMDAEVQALQRLLQSPAKPFVAILGGAKVSDKIGVIEHLIAKVDAILVGGGMANTFLFAQGIDVAASLAERDRSAGAQALLHQAEAKGVTIALPIDVVIATDLDGEPSTVAAGDLPQGHAIFDIGPKTVENFGKIIAAARTVFWNGPMGVFERPPFAAGTTAIAMAVASSGAFSVVGGGDSVAAVEQVGCVDQISHISTGGGASLEFVEGRTLPGLAALAASAAKQR